MVALAQEFYDCRLHHLPVLNPTYINLDIGRSEVKPSDLGQEQQPIDFLLNPSRQPPEALLTPIVPGCGILRRIIAELQIAISQRLSFVDSEPPPPTAVAR